MKFKLGDLIKKKEDVSDIDLGDIKISYVDEQIWEITNIIQLKKDHYRLIVKSSTNAMYDRTVIADSSYYRLATESEIKLDKLKRVF
jgi:hypothetical protein